MDPATQQLFQQLGLAALLGLLVGFERERADSQLAGVRTFPLVTVLGTLCALLGEHFGGWIVAAGFLGVTTFVVIGNVAKLYRGTADPGVTTEAAMLVMYGVGAYIVVGSWLVAVVIAGGVAVLLQFKPELHRFVDRFGDHESRAIMRFVLIACIILPVLPDKSFGPFAVFNPFETWLLVVMIVGISLAGYIAYKFLGEQAGTILGGILGGAISSTATTVSYSRRTASQPQLAPLAATVILIATAIVYLRVLAEIRVMAPAFLPIAAGPVLVLLGLAVVPAIGLWWFTRRAEHQMPEQEDPAEFREALFFALMYVGVLFGLAVARHYFSQGGLYVVAVLSGLTDMDAITLSASRMVARDEIEAGIGWRMIVLAAMANLVFKAGLVATLGNWRMFAWVAALFGLSLVGGGALFFAWPDSIRLPLPGLETNAEAGENEGTPPARKGASTEPSSQK
jgi:uncharacterized membrane protein (DUF4010 family)